MLFFLLVKVIQYRLSICVQNISRSFPDFSYQETIICVNQFYQNLANITIETLFPSIAKLDVEIHALMKIRMDDQISRPIILLLGHYGNWEVLNKLPRYTDMSVKALYKPIKNKWVDYLVRRRRTKYGLELIKSSQALRTLLKNKEKNSIILFLADQFPGDDVGIELDFLHQKTFMYTGAEQFARITGAYVGYLELHSKANHTWGIEIETICENGSNTKEGFITTRYAQLLEKSIYKVPALWLWSHRRWK